MKHISKDQDIDEMLEQENENLEAFLMAIRILCISYENNLFKPEVKVKKLFNKILNHYLTNVEKSKGEVK